MGFSDDILSFLKTPPKSKSPKSKVKKSKSPSPKSLSPQFYKPQSSPSPPKAKRGRPKTRKCAPGVKQADCKTRSDCLWTKGNFCRSKTNRKRK